MAAERHAGPWRLVPRLALADLGHESILTLCMIVALMAIIAPLMLLLGVRYGAIEMLRSRLVQNPTYREIWPAATLSLNDGWFERVRERPDVQFVIPTILRGASIIGARREADSTVFTFDLIPTADGDPLLRDFGASIPTEGEIVLSRPAAEQMGGVRAGEAFLLEVTRQRAGRRERETLPVRVGAVLPFEADGLERVYAPARLVVAVEQYREGSAVPDFQWPGEMPTPYPTFDGVILAVQTPLDTRENATLRIGTGFASVAEMAPATFTQITGVPPPANWTLYDVLPPGPGALTANINQLRDRVRGLGAVIVPYVKPMVVDLDSRSETVVGLSLGENEAALFGVRPTPWGAFDPDRSHRDLRQIMRRQGENYSGNSAVEISYNDHTISFPVRNSGSAEAVTVPVELLAILRTGVDRRIAWDDHVEQFKLQRGGYFGFRLYAHSIDQIPGLYRELLGDGLRVDAHVQQIERIQVLDKGLMRLFLMIASVGALGGSCALVASLYASVDRKKRDLGVMRLLGLSRLAVSGFPVFQGVALSICAVVLAAATFLAFSSVINISFASETVAGGNICHLPLRYYGYVTAFTVTAAFLSSIAAARRTTRIEPAEAIREE